MDRAEFQRYIDNAIQETERIRTYCTEDEIIIVMTANVYQELRSRTNITMYTDRNGNSYGLFLGCRIALINEPTEHTVFSPAVLGMTYHTAMELDDIIVINDENRVFRLASREPVQFTDTGMTVRFDVRPFVTGIDITVTNAGNIAAETIRAATAFAAATIATTTVDPYTVHPADTTTNTAAFRANPVATEINRSVLDMLTGVGKKRKKRAKEDEELSAGDTTAMDEFLDGFAIKQNLQQA